VKITQRYDRFTIAKLRELGFKTEQEFMYKKYPQDIILVLDFADKTSKAVGTARVKGTHFYLTVEKYREICEDMKETLSKLKEMGIVK
jgi:hypothetical protein